jgi:transcriptional regulator with XRE-family HTH domain
LLANVKKFKKEKGLTKSDLVRKTELDYHTIDNLERGNTLNPRITTLEKLAKGFEEHVKKSC